MTTDLIHTRSGDTLRCAEHGLPSLELAQRTLAYAHKAGLVVALMRTAGAQSDEELIDWMLRQGDLWFSICRLVEISEAQ